MKEIKSILLSFDKLTALIRSVPCKRNMAEAQVVGVETIYECQGIVVRYLTGNDISDEKAASTPYVEDLFHEEFYNSMDMIRRSRKCEEGLS